MIHVRASRHGPCAAAVTTLGTNAVEWVLDTRRRLRLNVSEGLALEALWLRLASTLG